MTILRNVLFTVSNIAAGITGFMFLILMFLFVVDVFGRYFFNAPIAWAFEVTEGLMALGISLGFAYAEVEDGHVRVRVFYDRMSKKARTVLDRITYVVAFIITALYCRYTYLDAIEDWQAGLHTDYLEIPIIVFQIFLPIGLGLWCAVILIKLISKFMGDE